jgi:tetratricopeptide (TPR) repeat protein
MRNNRKRSAAGAWIRLQGVICCLLCLLAASVPVWAADPVLEEINVLPDPRGSLIRIELNTPVRLISHTPERNGDLLHLQVQPILITGDAEIRDSVRDGSNRSSLTDRSRIGVLGRQTLLWSPTAAVPLVEVTYDGTGLQLVEPPVAPAIPGRPSQLDLLRRPAILAGSAEILLRFNRSVFYAVERDPDPRFLRVIVLGAAAGQVTLPPTEEVPEQGAPGSDGTDVPRTGAQPSSGAAAPAPSPVPTTPPTAAAVDLRNSFVVNLASSSNPIRSSKLGATQLPAGTRLYVAPFDRNGAAWYRLRLGFFPDAKSARAAKQALQSAYPDAWIGQASVAERQASAGTALGQAAAAATAPTAQPSAATESKMPAPAVGGETSASVEQARQALIDKDYDTAIGLLSRELENPNTQFRLEAQELLGIARERKGQFALAKADYEHYLELNPRGEDADRVKQRLDGLVTAEQNLREKLRLSKQEKIGGGPAAAGGGTQGTEVIGGISQIYRRENQFIEGVGTDPIQSGLQNDLDLNVRHRGDKANLQARFSGGYLYDFLENGPNPETRVSTLYIDAQDTEKKYQARIGRQSSTTGGVLGRFDGGLLGMRLNDWARLNFVSGCPVESSVNRAVHCEKAFYGLNADIGTFWNALSFNVFGIDQQFDGFTDRTAVGAEMRYFKPNYSLFTLVDYDVSYNEFNTFLLLGNYIFANQATLNLIVDHRTSPILTTANSLQGQLVDSLGSLHQFFTEDQFRTLAEQRTAISDAVTLGGSYPLNERFLLNGDVTLTNISGTDASVGLNGAPDVASTSRTGVEKIYGLQLIGSNLFKAGDTSIAGVRFSDFKHSNNVSFLFNERYPLTDTLRINPLLQFNHSDNDDNTEDWTVQPSLQLNYRLKERMQVEFETGAEWSLLGNTGGSSTEFHDYFASLGYRYDF